MPKYYDFMICGYYLYLSWRIIKEKVYPSCPTIRASGGYTFFFLSSSASNIFPKIFASFRRKAYLCRRKAALGNLKASFHCARLHFLCSTKVESLK